MNAEVDASFDPETDVVMVHGVPLSRGASVRLRPGARRADAQDMFLEGRTATVEAVLFDLDGAQHLAVTLDDLVELAESATTRTGDSCTSHPDEVEPIAGGRMMRILIAGLGNIFEGDDGFGVEVVQRLAAQPGPRASRCATSVSGACTWPTSCSRPTTSSSSIDAVQRGGEPGTVYVIEHGADADAPEPADERRLMDAHDLAPDGVLALVPAARRHARPRRRGRLRAGDHHAGHGSVPARRG